MLNLLFRNKEQNRTKIRTSVQNFQKVTICIKFPKVTKQNGGTGQYDFIINDGNVYLNYQTRTFYT
jgi:hypothetical protein